MDNAADEKKLKSARTKGQLENEEAIDDLKRIIRTPEGFRFFKKFFREGKLADISMTGNSWTFFNEGHRNFAKMVFSELSEADPKRAAQIFSELLIEAKEN